MDPKNTNAPQAQPPAPAAANQAQQTTAPKQVADSNLAAAIVRTKLDKVPQNNHATHSANTANTLNPATHAQHVAYPAERVDTTPAGNYTHQQASQPASYHQQQYKAATSTLPSTHQAHSVPQTIHQSNETIKPPKATPQPKQKQAQPVKENKQPSERSSTLKRKDTSQVAPKASFKKPIMIALILGFAYLIINYNEIAVAQVKQYVSPSNSISTPVIEDPNASPIISGESKVIIPKINVDAPVVYDVTSYEEDAIQAGLERGVVHYGTTALPGEIGNNVIVGHSSNNFFNTGKYKFAFVLLDRLNVDDTFSLNYQGTRYTYRIFNKQVIEPTDFSLIQPTDRPITTLITCSPPGTSWDRLVIQGEQILPDPSKAIESNQNQELPTLDVPVPGNAPSFWSQIF